MSHNDDYLFLLKQLAATCIHVDNKVNNYKPITSCSQYVLHYKLENNYTTYIYNYYF